MYNNNKILMLKVVEPHLIVNINKKVVLSFCASPAR